MMAVTPVCDGSRMSEHPLETDPLAWSRFARCDSADPDLFFPPDGADNRLAKSICTSCPVRRQCLDYALETKQKYGIWGGMTEAQRRRIRRDARANHPARQRPLPDRRAPATVATPVDVTAGPAAQVSITRGHLTLVR